MPAFDQNVKSALSSINSNDVLRFCPGQPVDHLKIMNQFATIGTWELHVATNEVFWSEETFRIHGLPYRAGPVGLKTALSFFVEADLRAVSTLLQQALRTRSGFRFRFRIKRSDGQLRVVESNAAPVVDDSGAVVKLVGVFRDITDHVGADNVRQSQQELLMRIVMSFPTAVAMFDRSLRFIANSTAWKDTFGIAPDRVLVGQKLADASPELSAGLANAFELALRGQPVGKNNDRLAVAGTSSIACDWVIQPWNNQTGAVGGLIVALNAKSKLAAGDGAKVVQLVPR